MHIDEIRSVVEIAHRAAREAGKIVQSMSADPHVSEKSRINLVTEADLRAEEAIAAILKSELPDAGILGEEAHDQQAADVERLWVVDPLDGTNNYAHGIPLYTCSIAYAERGEVLAGVVFDPVRDELFSAYKGGGALCNGVPVRVSSSNRTVEGSIVATGFHYDRGELMERTLDALRRLFRGNIRGMRRTGSAALDMCWTACGRYDAYFEYKLSPWDFAAGILLVSEAGGVCSDREGNSMNLGSTGVVCSNSDALHRELLRLVAWSR